MTLQCSLGSAIEALYRQSPFVTLACQMFAPGRSQCLVAAQSCSPAFREEDMKTHVTFTAESSTEENISSRALNYKPMNNIKPFRILSSSSLKLHANVKC